MRRCDCKLEDRSAGDEVERNGEAMVLLACGDEEMEREVAVGGKLVFVLYALRTLNL